MKVALITGAAGGIGYATVEKFNKEGYAVVAMDIVPEDKVCDKFSSFENVIYVSGNLANAEDRLNAVTTAINKFGVITALVNVAGVAPKVRNDILEMTEESYDFVMDINLKGTFFLTQLVANQMVKQYKNEGTRCYIANVSSCSAYTSSTSRGEYCMSKAGATMLTKLFADRLAEYGITVNEICPGIIATGMTEKVKEKYDNLIAGGLVPLGRWGTPQDCADALYALCSGVLGYTTGQSIIVDGGMHIQRL
ncbi:MAG: 3-ketoacyl-ACP reductase [Clostridia bacterium]|nr:3-ketoacyl-ACP reductase [Clostridia bacterium]MBR2296259.1 3-ketoacyl-ACP reductase [Clostridia bacterium]